VSSLTRLLRDLAPLFPPRTRRRLRFAVVGSIVMSFAEIVGLLVILPLIEMLSGASTKTGTLGRISAFFGHPSDGTLATILAAILLGAYLSKGIANIAFRWWLLGFPNGQEARNSAELLPATSPRHTCCTSSATPRRWSARSTRRSCRCTATWSSGC